MHLKPCHNLALRLQETLKLRNQLVTPRSNAQHHLLRNMVVATPVLHCDCAILVAFPSRHLGVAQHLGTMLFSGCNVCFNAVFTLEDASYCGQQRL